MDNTGDRPVFVGAGANLPHPSFASPRDTLQAALIELDRRGARVVRCSRWYRTAPVPASDQPWFVNVVAEIATSLSADDLLVILHEIEDLFGRVRSVPNAARLIDLDLRLSWGNVRSRKWEDRSAASPDGGARLRPAAFG